MAPTVTLFLNTYNRKDELRKALASALAQDLACEVMVLDDASSDGTPEMVRAEFPTVRLEASEKNLGLIAQRNRAARLSSSEILICMDDDAVLPSPSILSDTLKDFDDPRIGAVAIPYVDVLYTPKSDLPRAPAEGLHITSSYRGTAQALRRELFLEMGGYDERLGRYGGEESCYCIQMLEAGYVVRLGRAEQLLHYESPKREHARLRRLRERSGPQGLYLRQCALYFPAPHGHCRAEGLQKMAAQGHPLDSLAGICLAFLFALSHPQVRKPVSPKTYRRFMELRRKGSIRID